MKITINGRQFEFGANADEEEARRLVQDFLDAERELEEARAANDEQAVEQAKRGLYFIEGDLRLYQETTHPDFRWPEQNRQEEAPPLSPDAQAIVTALARVERAALADREMYADELGELSKSRAIPPEEETQ